MRELVTIGDLRSAGPAMRSRVRRVSYLRSIGQTNPGFAPGVTSSSAGSTLQDAATSLLNYLDSNGVPSEHVSDPNVVAFQTDWNADPGNAAASAQLSVDGGYGPNVHDALNAIVGGIAPNVNTGAAPVPSKPGGTTPTPTAPGTTPSSGMSGMGILLLLAAAAGVGYLAFGRKKRSTSIIVRRNPRRRRRML